MADPRNILLGRTPSFNKPLFANEEDLLTFYTTKPGAFWDELVLASSKEVPTYGQLRDSQLIQNIFEASEYPKEARRSSKAEKLFFDHFIDSIQDYFVSRRPVFLDQPLLIDSKETADILYGRGSNRDPIRSYTIRLLQGRDYRTFFDRLLPSVEYLENQGIPCIRPEYLDSIITESLVGGRVYTIEEFPDDPFYLYDSDVRPISFYTKRIIELVERRISAGEKIHDPDKLILRLKKMASTDSQGLIQQIDTRIRDRELTLEELGTIYRQTAVLSVQRALAIIAANNLPEENALNKYSPREIIDVAREDVQPVTLLRRLSFLVDPADRETYLNNLKQRKDEINNRPKDIVYFLKSVGRDFIRENLYSEDLVFKESHKRLVRYLL